MKCPKCGSTNVETERRMNGVTTCKDCYFVGKALDFLHFKNGDAVPASYEELEKELAFRKAEIVVYKTEIEELKAAIIRPLRDSKIDDHAFIDLLLTVGELERRVKELEAR